MKAANSLPIYVKRASAAFLILALGYFSNTLRASDPPGGVSTDIKNTIKTVVIDAGHGGKDSGAVGKISKEKDLALDISLKLGKLIEENVEDVKVVYTRKTDVFPALHERAKIANDNNADLFISIHVNANERAGAYGTSTHVLGLHRTGESFETAVRENSVIMLEEDYETKYQGFDPKDDKSYVIFSVMQNTYHKQSIEFAHYVQDQFKDKAKRHNRGVVQQGLLVLAQTAMPGVLIETGFISNREEEKYLNSEYGQDIIASSIYRAFKQYKARIEEHSNFTIDESALSEEAPQEETKSLAETIQAGESEAIPENTLSFLVQVASSRNPVSTEPSAFKGYENVLRIQEGRWYKYAIGHYQYHEALEKCAEIKKDFPGAFVIALKNKKVVPLGDALKEINK